MLLSLDLNLFGIVLSSYLPYFKSHSHHFIVFYLIPLHLVLSYLSSSYLLLFYRILSCSILLNPASSDHLNSSYLALPCRALLHLIFTNRSLSCFIMSHLISTCLALPLRMQQEWMSDSLSKGFYNGKPNPFEVNGIPHILAQRSLVA